MNSVRLAGAYTSLNGLLPQLVPVFGDVFFTPQWSPLLPPHPVPTRPHR
jgi:hypothetical protein